MRIFLCYTSTDRDVADRIRLALIAEQHKVFFDRNELVPGKEYHKHIAEEIQESELFLFLLSPEAVSVGRYTLTELSLAERKWNHPSGHVLPVMIRPTPIEHIPSYLKVVTIFEPKGDIPAEVSAYVRRMPQLGRSWVRWIMGGAALAAVGVLLFWLSAMGTHVRLASDLHQAARSFATAGEYAQAWNKIKEARSHITESPVSAVFQRTLHQNIIIQQVDIAMDWLDNMQVGEGETFAGTAAPLIPILDEAIGTTEGQRKADILAHRGWADFLRSTDSGLQYTPDSYYDRALKIDPANVYAHTMWGHWMTWMHGDLDEARKHFKEALAGGRARPYVRRLQVAAMENTGEDEGKLEILRVAHDMWEHKEEITKEVRRPVRTVYTFTCGLLDRNEVDKLVKALPEREHISLIHGLFSHPVRGEDPSPWWEPCVAKLQEKAGMNEDARKSYRSLRASYSPGDPGWNMANDAIKRLSSAKPK